MTARAQAIVSLPGYAIEDVALANVQFTFPGGGTAEQAQRLDVAEMLHCHDYMEWARPFDGPLPGSVLYLRHVRGVRLENVRLTIQKADARPFIAGDDVDGLTLQDVVASTPGPVPGLAKLADAQRVTTRNCRVEAAESVPLLVAPTAEEQRRLADLRRARQLSTRPYNRSPMPRTLPSRPLHSWSCQPRGTFVPTRATRAKRRAGSPPSRTRTGRSSAWISRGPRRATRIFAAPAGML